MFRPQCTLILYSKGIALSQTYFIFTCDLETWCRRRNILENKREIIGCNHSASCICFGTLCPSLSLSLSHSHSYSCSKWLLLLIEDLHASTFSMLITQLMSAELNPHLCSQNTHMTTWWLSQGCQSVRHSPLGLSTQSRPLLLWGWSLYGLPSVQEDGDTCQFGFYYEDGEKAESDWLLREWAFNSISGSVLWFFFFLLEQEHHTAVLVSAKQNCPKNTRIGLSEQTTLTPFTDPHTVD